MGISPLDTATGLQQLNPLDTGRVGNVPLQPSLAEMDRFQSAMERAGMITPADKVEAPVRVAQVEANTMTDATTPAERADAAGRAVQGLELTTDTEVAGTGQTILEGLGRLRGMFDSQLDDVNRYSTVTNPFDTASMMQLQAELVQFSLVVDVTSKLAGKSTQALDSLMKGQ